MIGSYQEHGCFGACWSTVTLSSLGVKYAKVCHKTDFKVFKQDRSVDSFVIAAMFCSFLLPCPCGYAIAVVQARQHLYSFNIDEP